MNPSRMAPPDGQAGNVLAQPLIWPVSTLPKPRRALALGLESMSYLNKALLLELFGYEGARRCEAGAPLPPLAEDEGVVVVRLADARALPWREFSEWLGRRWAVVDIRAAAAMFAADGFHVNLQKEVGNHGNALCVMRSRMPATVYPNAPRVKIIASSDMTRGFSENSEAHFHGVDADGTMSLQGLIHNEALERVLKEYNGKVAGVTAKSLFAALICLPTASGGRVSVMDLEAVNRLPQPSGSEAPAVQIFMNSLGMGGAVFGTFCCALSKYEDFIELMAGLAGHFPGLAHIDTIGKSDTGRAIYRLRIGSGTPKPAVLFTCGIHPFEWGNAYGLLRYAAFLLEQTAANTAYAKWLLSSRQVHLVPAVVPDGWEARDQPASGLNHNRNFPGGWEQCVAGEKAWDTYNKRFAPEDAQPEITRGAAPGSAPETRALMALLERPMEPVSILGDFHETTAPESFLHPHEEPDGTVRDWPYYLDLAASLADAFNGRFMSHANLAAFGPGLSDFPSYRMRMRESLSRPISNAQSAWIQYALGKIQRALVVEAAGADATNYQTIRRTEYAALAAEQILAAEGGRLIRNPFSSAREVSVLPARLPARASAHIMDARGAAVEHRALPMNGPWQMVLPPGGWAWLEYV